MSSTSTLLTPGRWYALWVLSNSEFVVEDILRGYGIEAFLPVWIERVQWSDRQKNIRRPLFPGYLFVKCDEALRREVLRIAGVIEVLPTSLNPQPIDGEQIETVRRILESRLPIKPCEYVTGDEIRIDRGPMAGIKGVVHRSKNGTRLVVKIEMLQRAVSVEVDAADVLREPA